MTGVGPYHYDLAQPHALSKVDNTGSFVHTSAQTITYNGFNKVETINTTLNTGLNTLLLTYGPDQQRWKTQLLVNGTLMRQTIFAGDYEAETEGSVTRQLYYIYGGEGLAAIYVKETGKADNVYYAITDHLGSILQMVDASGNAVYSATYDVWGCRYVTNGTLPLRRGYGGHEHLDEFNLINMNGRLYDQFTGRFLSPDPYVQMPGNSQNINRYSYCLNNPLKYTDPSGEVIFSMLASIFCPPLLPIALGVDMGWMSGGFKAEMNGKSFWSGAWRGGIEGLVGGSLGMVGGGTMLTNVLWGLGEGAVTGGLHSLLYGENIWNGMLTGAAIGGAFAAATSGIEALNNYADGDGLYTNEGVIRKYLKDERYQDAINFTQERFGMTYGLGGEKVSMTYDENFGYAYGVTDPDNGDIRIGSMAIASSSALKSTMAHEYAHSVKDRMVLGGVSSGFNKHIGVPPLPNEDRTLYDDGPIGYANEIFNSGRLHIPYKFLPLPQNGNVLWNKWQGGPKWLYAIPMRFNNTVSLRYY